MEFGISQTGQHYLLSVENGVHEAVFEQRQYSYDEMSDAERRMQQGAVGADKTIEIARHDFHRQRVIKLTQYCIENGLLDQKLAA